MELLVSTESLANQRSDPRLKIIETSWKPEGYGRAHIDGALQLPWHSYLKSIDENGERSVHLVRESEFLEILGQLGIRSHDRIVAYDEYHGLFATRLWWVFNYFGFRNVSVLNGGWQHWLEKGFPISARIESPAPGTDFEPRPEKERSIHLKELRSKLDSSNLQIWDARREAEYIGVEETSNRRNGHIPGAINLDWTHLLEEPAFEGGSRKIKPVEELESICKQAGFDRESEIVCHCQASIRGAFVSFVLELLGHPRHRVYDAAMAEWANRDDTPLET